MAVGNFLIRERPDIGGFRPREGPAEFIWNADRRNAPIQPWPGGVEQRTARVDYPGGDNPSEQVLGPNFKPFTLTGRWSDKFNPIASNPGDPGGYAINEWRRFLAMVRRGNVVQVSFKSLTFFGIITDFDWEYRREYDIGYSFTVSPHRREGTDELTQPASAPTTKDANTLSREIQDRIFFDMLAIDSRKPDTQLAGTVSPLSSAQLRSLEDASSEFNEVVSSRVLQTDSDSFLSVRRAIASGDLLIGRAQTKINEAGGLRSDTALMYQTALGVLDFETWNRGLASQARLVVTSSWDARQQLDEQAEPNAIALYRPFKNESLYSISNRFYNTPNNWRLIKERNRLTSSNLDGTELLIIPEAPPQ